MATLPSLAPRWQPANVFGDNRQAKVDKKGYVSKQQQLNRLRERMEEERSSTRRLHNDVSCKRCSNDAMAL